MPEVSRFFGIVIVMYYADHQPSHFQARYGEFRAAIQIGSNQVIEGTIPPRVLGLVVEWATKHQSELAANWRRARERKPLLPIAPLE